MSEFMPALRLKFFRPPMVIAPDLVDYNDKLCIVEESFIGPPQRQHGAAVWHLRSLLTTWRAAVSKRLSLGLLALVIVRVPVELRGRRKRPRHELTSPLFTFGTVRVEIALGPNGQSAHRGANGPSRRPKRLPGFWQWWNAAQ